MVFSFHQGTVPILISVPHAGLDVPKNIISQLSDEGKCLTDTDWHVDRLYAPLKDLGVSMLVAQNSRYVVDLNRPADGSSLYPGQTTTSLCPLETFKGEALYKPGLEPDGAEIKRRTENYWKPYHAKLAQELARIKKTHGHATLWDAHSINNTLPRLFEGQLPDLNFGTNGGKACEPDIIARVMTRADTRYSSILNSRFKGGVITRTYGQPTDGVNAIQLEMAQVCYMDQETFEWDEEKAKKVQGTLSALFEILIAS